VLDDLISAFRIDTTRLYATGLSRGGFLVHRLAAELSHRLAAVAAVGATLPVPVKDQHLPRGLPRPLGVLHAHGTADAVVMYAGKPGHYLSVPESHAYWLQRNGLERTAVTTEEVETDTTDGTRITVTTRAGGRQSGMLVTIHEGGHTWAGADPFNIGLPIGRTSRDVDLNDVIWRFFAAHRRQ
jgi:polyhydroxybutyrate depolymerase